MKNKLLLFAKGMAMGAADVIPGVSGGTIAFITGIYEELINSLKELNIKNLQLLFKKGFLAFIKKTNILFLIILSSGISVSILSLAKGIKYLLLNDSILIMAFFFGLIAASVLLFIRKIERWNWKTIITILLATTLAFFITIAEPLAPPDSTIYLFFSGFLAIIAMILPGISGAFILLLMGSYHSIIDTLDSLQTGILSMSFDLLKEPLINLVFFGSGALIGLLLFSNVVSWLFRKYKQLTLAVLTGLLIGSLNKVWPWKKVLSYRVNSKGEQIPFLDQNISPFKLVDENYFVYAILIALVGFFVIYTLERIFEQKHV